MRSREADGSHDDADGFVGAQVECLLLCWESGVAKLSLEQDWVVVVRVETIFELAIFSSD